MSDELPIVNISTQPIELCKLLKIANMVSGGGEAKIVIGEGYVYLNSEVEFQKRKKVYDQDIIEFNGDIVKVKLSSKNTKNKNKNEKISKTNNKTQKKEIMSKPETLAAPIPTHKNKRKPISF